MAHSGQSLRLIAAVGLCVFRSGEAWDILLDILRGKPKSDEISRIAIVLFYHSFKGIQAQDEKSAKMIDFVMTWALPIIHKGYRIYRRHPSVLRFKRFIPS